MMGAGTYTSPERIERDGYLIAFEGEVMTADEALRRGIDIDDTEDVAEVEAEEPADEAAVAPVTTVKTRTRRTSTK
jgi:hypothetical protein